MLSNDVSYYGDRTVGTSGPALGDTRMVKEISELLAKDSRFPKDAIVDYDGDGCVDNLMIVTACERVILIHRCMDISQHMQEQMRLIPRK